MARLIRTQPNFTSVREAQLNLRDSGVELLDDLPRAALMMSCEALDHRFVTTKPFGCYNDNVVNQCIILKEDFPVLSNGLRLSPQSDMCVHFLLWDILANLGI
ncbi:hypothetical protein N7541_000511 [Penicillium brevicompactum]|uniref:Uncharacterized protein n=1 Tax=Penicillium brevicompactum TaxID=5074 RepID=A0A9W9RVV1_PENBR|nr:hypothetical protein N7541_000511 [Penicillium brevicompactum]